MVFNFSLKKVCCCKIFRIQNGNIVESSSSFQWNAVKQVRWNFWHLETINFYFWNVFFNFKFSKDRQNWLPEGLCDLKLHNSIFCCSMYFNDNFKNLKKKKVNTHFLQYLKKIHIKMFFYVGSPLFLYIKHLFLSNIWANYI